MYLFNVICCRRVATIGMLGMQQWWHLVCWGYWQQLHACMPWRKWGSNHIIMGINSECILPLWKTLEIASVCLFCWWKWGVKTKDLGWCLYIQGENFSENQCDSTFTECTEGDWNCSSLCKDQKKGSRKLPSLIFSSNFYSMRLS